MHRSMLWVLAALAAPAMAQSTDPNKPQQPPATTPPAATQPTKPPATAQPPATTQPTATPPSTDDKARRERLVKASKLPRKATEVRAKGVPASDVKEAMAAAKSKGVKAGDMAEVAEEHGKAVDEHGPIDNFGAFVKAKLDEGLRGRELAAAIRAEHAKRGKGKGFKPDKGPPSDKGKGKPEAKPDKGKEDKSKDDKDKHDDHGKPDDAGKGKGKGKG